MHTSTVKWFDAKKGYGFINHPAEGDDVFVHYSNIESDEDFKTLESGQEVEFEMDDGPKGLHAPEVVPLEEEPSSEAEEEASPEITPADVDPTATVSLPSTDGESS